MEGGGHARCSSGQGGWPLGLHVMTRLQSAMASREQLLSLLQYTRRQQRGAATAPPFLAGISTSSISSFSSSDLDTESTGSTFFPERSTTLGTLIGIHNSGAHRHGLHNQPAAIVTAQLFRCKPPSLHLKAASQKLHGCCCSVRALLTACANSPAAGGLDSPSEASLAYLLELERRSTHHSQPEQDKPFSPCHSFDDLEAAAVARCHSLNTLFDGDGIRPPAPAGPPVKAPVQGQLTSSPLNSSYYSVFCSISRSGKLYPTQR